MSKAVVATMKKTELIELLKQAKALLEELEEGSTYHRSEYEAGAVTCAYCEGTGWDFAVHHIDCVIYRTRAFLEKIK